jgi:hypothetical protein
VGEVAPVAPPAVGPSGVYHRRRKAREQISKENEKTSAQTAIVFVVLLDGLVASVFGDEARMTEGEREMITPPLTRILARLEPATADIIDRWADPIVLLFGFIAYGSRVYALQQEKRKREDETRQPVFETPQPTPAYPGNGSGQRDDSRIDASPPRDVLENVGIEEARI